MNPAEPVALLFRRLIAIAVINGRVKTSQQCAG